MEIEIPDSEDAACALDAVEAYLVKRGQYELAGAVGDAMRRIRADSDEIAARDREIAELRADLEWAVDHRLGAWLTVDDTHYIEWVPDGSDGSEVCEEEYDGPPEDLRAAIRQARKGGE